MRLIRPAMGNVGRICGEQKPSPGKAYRRSRHCLEAACAEGALLYHTLTGALMLIPAGEDGDSCRDEMIRHWFLVPEDFDEKAHADGVRQIARVLNKSSRHKTRFTILTTTDCNARCFYCYEMGIRRVPMTARTAADVAEYIARVCGGKPVKLSWFGGEPLYNREAIETITALLRERGVAFESKITTNGYYLDGETARRAAEAWNVKKAQITLDGTEAVYNRIKAYIDSDGNPFRRVMGNIEGALQCGIRVTVRLNMDAKNAEDLGRLVDELAERFGGRVRVYARLLKGFSGNVHDFETEQLALERFRALTEKIIGLGMQEIAPLPEKYKLNHCMADDDQSEVILPDGRVCRCEHYVENEVVGSIYAPERDAALTAAWKQRIAVPECGECPLYPCCTKLVKCEWYRDGCTQTMRGVETEALKRQILAAYREAKDGRKQACS